MSTPRELRGIRKLMNTRKEFMHRRENLLNHRFDVYSSEDAYICHSDPDVVIYLYSETYSGAWAKISDFLTPFCVTNYYTVHVVLPDDENEKIKFKGEE